MKKILSALLLLAGCLAGCTPAPHTIIDYGADGVHFDTTVDRSLEGLQITKAPDGTIAVILSKSQSSASAVVAANIELEKIRAEALTSTVAGAVTAAVQAIKPKVP